MRLIDTQIKRKFASIIAIVLATDIAIFLNVPILRQILGALCFTIIPGLLLLHILKLNRISLLKRFVLSIGLSISFLIFAGLLINGICPLIGILKPLSTTPLVVSYSAILMGLCIIGYKRNKDDLGFIVHNRIKIKIKDNQLVYPLIFSFVFPLLSFLGTHLMNVTGNNIALLILIFLIPAYAALIVYHREKIPAATYPVAIWMISIALLLLFRARGFIIGGDFGEGLYMTATTMYWDVGRHSAINACLSTGFINTIYGSILGIKVLDIYRFLVPSLFSLFPLILFLIYRRYVGDSYAFLGALFFMSQFSFIGCGVGGVRDYLGLFFFALAMMVHFDDGITKLNKRVLFLIFIFSLIVSYYSYSYLFFITIFTSWGILFIFKAVPKIEKLKKESVLSGAATALSGIFIFAWWSQLTDTHFSAGVKFFNSALRSMGDALVVEAKSEMAQKSFGMGLEGEAEILNLVFYYTALILIFIGSIELIRRLIYKDSKFKVEYTSMIFVTLIIWAVAVGAPSVGHGFSIERIYFFSLVLLSPSLIVGAETICRLPSSIKALAQTGRFDLNQRHSNPADASSNMRRRTYIVSLLVIVVIIMQLMVNMGITYQMFGNHHSVILNSDGLKYDIWYVHTQEVMSAGWLVNHVEQAPKVHTLGRYMGRGFAPFYEELNKLRYRGSTSERYIYLGYPNVVEGKVITGLVRKTAGTPYAPMENYSSVFVGKSRIYNNGGSEVWE